MGTRALLRFILWHGLIFIGLKDGHSTSSLDNWDDRGLGSEPASASLRIALLNHVIRKDWRRQVVIDLNWLLLNSDYRDSRLRLNDNGRHALVLVLMVRAVPVSMLDVMVKVFFSMFFYYRWQYVAVRNEHGRCGH